MRKSIMQILPILLQNKGFPQLNMVCPSITPTLGPNLLTDPGLEAWDFASDLTSYQKYLFGDSSLAREGTTKRSGSYSAKMSGTTGFARILQGLNGRTPGNYIKLSAYVKSDPAGATGRIQPEDQVVIFPYFTGITATTDWVNHYCTNLIYGTNGVLMSVKGMGDLYVDDLVECEIDLASTLVYIGDHHVMDGTYTCTPTATRPAAVGMVIEYKDINNFVMATIAPYQFNVETSVKVKLYKRVGGGAFTEVIDSAFPTYVAGAPLSVVVSGTDHSLYYNSVQIGTTKTIDNSGMGTKVYGHSADALNTVGTVTTLK